eukprot:TRINITY_DN65626_c10_g2_i3.p2 TRINITY_DN65626_c10_g2~~TRINITY_DN65626_c10_g2_i3.p2  ORF type:complete len:113 (+),score=54.52 TRINITY_DN65626_c10_g2_i3:50-340(+)
MLTRFLSRSTAAVLRRSAATSHTRVGAVVSSRRWFGDAPSGHFLAEDEVRGRVLDVVKNFPKVPTLSLDNHTLDLHNNSSSSSSNNNNNNNNNNNG